MSFPYHRSVPFVSPDLQQSVWKVWLREVPRYGFPLRDVTATERFIRMLNWIECGRTNRIAATIGADSGLWRAQRPLGRICQEVSQLVRTEPPDVIRDT